MLLLLVGGIVFYLMARERPEDMGFVSLREEADDVKAADSAAIDSESSFTRYKAVLANWRTLSVLPAH